MIHGGHRHDLGLALLVYHIPDGLRVHNDQQLMVNDSDRGDDGFDQHLAEMNVSQ